MLLQVGKFYEAVGLDALLLVEYGAGLYFNGISGHTISRVVSNAAAGW
jgi:hypothetical protein